MCCGLQATGDLSQDGPSNEPRTRGQLSRFDRVRNDANAHAGVRTMSKAARSLFFFKIYVIALGLFLPLGSALGVRALFSNPSRVRGTHTAILQQMSCFQPSCEWQVASPETALETVMER